VDVRRELVVVTPPEDLAGERGADVEMRDLRRGVYARVAAAGPVQFEVLAGGDGANGAVDLALYRARVFLNLPAAVARAGVLDRQLETWHRLVDSRRGTARPAPACRGPRL